jgi:hypothetical protein
MPSSGQVMPMDEPTYQFKRLIARSKNPTVNFSPLKKFINNGYSTINTVKTMYINADNELGFDERHVSFSYVNNMITIDHNGNEISRNTKKKAAVMFEADGRNEHNDLVRYTKFAWRDGSEVLADSRGFLHLRSSDKAIPHIIILMIMGKPTACWASDGDKCGPEYFTGQKPMDDVHAFYANYIERFIDIVNDYAT